MMATLRLVIAARMVRAELVGRRGRLWAGETACEKPDALREAIAQLAGESSFPRRSVRVAVTLGSPPLQVRTLRGLPPVRTRELRAMVAAHAGRYFRQNGSPLVTDASWAGPQARQDGLATAVAVEEPWVEAVLAGAAAAGLEVWDIQPDLGAGTGSMTLLSGSERHRRGGHARRINRRLAVVVTAVWAVTAFALAARFERERRSIERELARLEVPAAAVARARRSLGDAAAMVGTLESADQERGALLARTGLIAAALPDSAHLSSLTLDASGNGSMSGEARRAAQAIAGLEAAAAVVSLRPVGPVTSESNGARIWERFSVAFGADTVR